MAACAARRNFRNARMFEFLWRAGYAHRRGRAISASVDITLDHICEGGIYDHLGGGFARYSVDERWLVPHFEKMLYDNAQLLELLAVAHARSDKPLYRERAQETVDWLAREMTTAEGAFSASLDADSEGEEGKFYVWSLRRRDQRARRRGCGEFFARHYDVTPDGNFEGHNILNRLKPYRAARKTSSGSPRCAQTICRPRAKRVRPGLDDKVLADWNGLMIAALANAGRSLASRPGSRWRSAPSLHRACHDPRRPARPFLAAGPAQFPGPGIGLRRHDQRRAGPLRSDRPAKLFGAGAVLAARARSRLCQCGGWDYFLTAADAEGLVIRPASTNDEATPNHNAVAAQNLVRLALFTGDDQWRDKADRLIAASRRAAVDNLYMHMALMNAIDLRLRAAEIVVTGEGARADALLAARAQLRRLIVSCCTHASAEALPPSHPAHAQVRASRGPQAFVCVAETCSLPVTDPAGLTRALQASRQI